MKQLIKVIALLLAVVVLAACGNNNNNNIKTNETVASKMDAGHHQMNMNTNKAGTSAVNIIDDKLNAVYQQYIDLANALVKSDAPAARIASNAIEAGAKDLERGDIVAATAAKITATTNIESQRAAFATLSNNLIELVKRSGLQTGELYVDFCPMAMNDKGAYWLSSTKTINNPYFGEKMLTCGEVKETIK